MNNINRSAILFDADKPSDWFIEGEHQLLNVMLNKAKQTLKNKYNITLFINFTNKNIQLSNFNSKNKFITVALCENTYEYNMIQYCYNLYNESFDVVINLEKIKKHNEIFNIIYNAIYKKYNIIMKKFDCIIQNPPYDGQLHLKIFEEAIKHLTPNGTCVNLSPTPWLAKSNINRPMAKYRKTFNGKIKNIEVIDHATANAMFGTGNSIEELGIYTVKNDDSTPVDLMNYGFNNAAEKSLYDKINMINPKAGVITYNKAALDIRYGRVSAKTAYCNKGCTNINIRKSFDVPIYTWHGGKTCKEAVLMLDSKKKVSMVLYFNSQVEHDNFINSLDTVFMNWYYQMFVVPGDYKIINYMFRMSDYSQPWDDARFYKFFNITAEEQKIIEETMEKYK